MPGVFALYKKGNTKATSLHDTEEEAQAALAEAAAKGKAQYEIRQRPAEQKRCADYCAAFQFCTQGQALVKATNDFRLAQHWSVSGPRASAA